VKGDFGVDFGFAAADGEGKSFNAEIGFSLA
jgi:hypothetical protein